MKPPDDRRRERRDRQRRYRERLRSGHVIAPVAVDLPVIDALIELRWLPEERSEDRNAVAEAIRALLADVAAALRNKP